MKKKLVYSLIVAIVLVALIPAAILADSQLRALNGALTAFQGMSCSYVGGAADYTVLNDSNGDTSYAKVNAAGSPYYGRIAWPTQDFAESHSAITKVTITTVARREGVSGSGTIGGKAYISGAWYGGWAYSLDVGSYTTHNYDFTTNPATGLAWEAAEINAASFGFQANQDNIRVTFCNIYVYYDPPEAPTTTTDAATGIDSDEATLNGTVTDDGNDTVDYYGFVWDTSDKGDPGNADPSTPPGTWTNGWKSAEGDYGENPFDHSTGATLAQGTTYYFRAAAHNGGGWEYGDAVSFVTVDTPAITTQAATFVGATSARLNAKIDDDSGDACTVTFAYKDGTHASYAAIVAAGGTETAATGTWATGTFPYITPSSLVASTTYSFACKAVNDAGTAYGSVITFMTESGIYAPSDLIAIPSDDDASMIWVRGDGSPTTLLRYQEGTYPDAVDVGTMGYFGNSTSVNISSLTSGTTYYVSTWGYDDGTYSDNYTTVMFTTLAYGAVTGDTLETPEEYEPWNQTPSASKMDSWPLVGGLIIAISNTYETETNWIWYLIVIFVSTGAGVIVYNKGGYNKPLSGGVAAFILMVGAITFESIWLWAGFAFALIFVGFTYFGDRR